MFYSQIVLLYMFLNIKAGMYRVKTIRTALRKSIMSHLLCLEYGVVDNLGIEHSVSKR